MEAWSFYPDPLTVSAVVGFVLTALTAFWSTPSFKVLDISGITGGMFFLYGMIYVARVVYFASIPRLPAGLFSPSSPLGSALSVTGPVLFLCCWVGWLVMGYERLLVELMEQEAETEAMAQRAVAADAVKSEFLGVIGHEIRNPLSAGMTLTDLMAQAARRPN